MFDEASAALCEAATVRIEAGRRALGSESNGEAKLRRLNEAVVDITNAGRASSGSEFTGNCKAKSDTIIQYPHFSDKI
jgi:hypothetical protein